MGYHENMEMERSRRKHEYEKKFGKDRETPHDPDWNKKHFPQLFNRHETEASRQEDAHYRRLNEIHKSEDPIYPHQQKNK